MFVPTRPLPEGTIFLQKTSLGPNRTFSSTGVHRAWQSRVCVETMFISRCRLATFGHARIHARPRHGEQREADCYCVSLCSGDDIGSLRECDEGHDNW